MVVVGGKEEEEEELMYMSWRREGETGRRMGVLCTVQKRLGMKQEEMQAW